MTPLELLAWRVVELRPSPHECQRCGPRERDLDEQLDELDADVREMRSEDPVPFGAYGTVRR